MTLKKIPAAYIDIYLYLHGADEIVAVPGENCIRRRGIFGRSACQVSVVRPSLEEHRK